MLNKTTTTANHNASTLVFADPSEFKAYYAACEWLELNGYSVGSAQRNQPCGILRGDYVIAKWRNLNTQQRAALDGTMTGDFRHGPVTITLKGRQC